MFLIILYKKFSSLGKHKVYKCDKKFYHFKKIKYKSPKLITYILHNISKKKLNIRRAFELELHI